MRVLSCYWFPVLLSHSPDIFLPYQKTDKTLVVLDYNSLKVMAKIPAGEDPHEVVASGDGSAASIANMVNRTAHEINVIDLKI